jgi:putative membrane protein
LASGERIAYWLLTVPVNMLAGVTVTFSSEPIYRYYLDVPRPWGLTMMQDQMLGGVIMWIPGSMMFLIAVLVIVARMLAQQERRVRHVPVTAPG